MCLQQKFVHAQSVLSGRMRGKCNPSFASSSILLAELKMVRPLPDQKEVLILWAMQDEGYLGRYRLVSIVGLTEGVTRGYLTRLAGRGYVKTKKFVGCYLTKKGEKRLRELLAKLKICEIKEIDPGNLSLASKSVVAHIRDRARYVRSGIEQRDAAIKAGASGAITVIFHDGRFLLPPDNFDLSRKNVGITERFRQEFQLSEGDVLVIGSAEDKWRAVEGVLGAAQTMLSPSTFRS